MGFIRTFHIVLELKLTKDLRFFVIGWCMNSRLMLQETKSILEGRSNTKSFLLDNLHYDSHQCWAGRISLSRSTENKVFSFLRMSLDLKPIDCSVDQVRHDPHHAHQTCSVKINETKASLRDDCQ